MLFTYIDVIVIIVVLQFFGILFLMFWKHIEVKTLKKDVNRLKSGIPKTIKRVSFLEVSDTKMLAIINLNIDDINCSKVQIEQLQKYITQTQPYMQAGLEISNLLGCIERDISPAELIEKVKADIDWERELEKRKAINEYYEGD